MFGWLVGWMVGDAGYNFLIGTLWSDSLLCQSAVVQALFRTTCQQAALRPTSGLLQAF
jgi:hypothetical protein